MNLSRAFAGVVILSASALLYVLLCQYFCFPHCWVRCVTLQGHRGSSIQQRPGMHFLWGYSRVPDGKPFLQSPCQQCAVVSSSGQMLGSRLGKEIDRAACVLRMNQAPTQGYEEDVGSRVTVRVVSHTSVPLLLRNESYFFGLSQDTLYVIWGPPKLMSRDNGGSTYRTLKKMKDMHPSVQIYTLTEAKMTYCDQIFQNETGKNRVKSGSYLSTGWFTMILAMELCEHISVYGMVSSNYCRGKNLVPIPYHYFEKRKLDECKMYLKHERAARGAHRFITEKMVFSRWAKQKDIVFTHPSWKDT
uniref:alpha-N-acetylneuraminyl-2,3-beta-galactosyl-1,3-N-acetylgalactosaminide6-alpha-sialyltransferase n=1 Tax=Geotrypetes seraphini TaxID=260995 RepID=A0A6P8RIW3_GEOSA|nr:alpha-N-acetyl-neuraminyl-2,3-beta-galactosyl-1,3-N-acetyl-galactosaminide alpha-2,6-sialyltransferase [Geotrypetes seraphini]